MKLKLSKINGTNQNLDYDLLEKSFINKLELSSYEAEVVILNNFPMPVSTKSNVDIIILLNIPQKTKNYYRVVKNKNNINVYNQIVAISLIDEYYESNKIELENHNIDEIANKLKWGLTNYLSSNCNLKREYITIHPIIWIKNKFSSDISKYTLVDNQLTYDKIEEVIKLNEYFKWQGYKDWINDQNLLEFHVKNIFEQASMDSSEGYITRKKIDRIFKKMNDASNKAYLNIGKKLVEVSGKAGTGKSSDLLKWMLQSSIKGSKGVFLTYNHVLVYDISSQIKSFENRLRENGYKKQPTTTYTIHSYFYNLSKKLGILLLLSEKRIDELSKILKIRLKYIYHYLEHFRKINNDISLSKVLMYIQNNETGKVMVNDNTLLITFLHEVNYPFPLGLEEKKDEIEGIKREAIALIKFLKKQNTLLPDFNETKKQFREFLNLKLKRIKKELETKVFLIDYYNILKYILKSLTDLDKFIDELNITNKYNLLSNLLNLNEEFLNEDGSIDKGKLINRYKRSIDRFAANRTAYIDEAQDCHKDEKEIFFKIFESKNIVIANGGKEQLIRHNELCNWQKSRYSMKEIVSYKYSKRAKSFRMKPAIAALTNHIASWFGLDLQIEPIQTEDHGNIFLDTKNDNGNEIDFIKELNKIGKRQGCTNLESLLLLKDSTKIKGGEKKDANESIRINEFNNIKEDYKTIKKEWNLINKASEEEDLYFWNATGNIDKRLISFPTSMRSRAIYYESCRGIEAWSIMCFNLDDFFTQKINEKEADNYMLNTLFDQLNPQKRREMYAATWVIMAITRSIENCYIKINNLNHPLSKSLIDFKKQYPQFCSNLF